MVDGTPSLRSDAERAPGAVPDGDERAGDQEAEGAEGAGEDRPQLAHHQADAADEQVRLVEDYLERRRLMPRLRAKR